MGQEDGAADVAQKSDAEEQSLCARSADEHFPAGTIHIRPHVHAQDSQQLPGGSPTSSATHATPRYALPPRAFPSPPGRSNASRGIDSTHKQLQTGRTDQSTLADGSPATSSGHHLAGIAFPKSRAHLWDREALSEPFRVLATVLFHFACLFATANRTKRFRSSTQ